MKLTVAGAQLPVGEDINENLKAINRAIDFAVDAKADILLTPEGSLSGYTPRFNASEVVSALEVVTAKARSVKLGLALGTCFVEPEDRRCYNQLRFYDQEGVFLGFHSKILRCGDVMSEEPQGECTLYDTTPLRTFNLNGIVIGGLICNDVWANPLCTIEPDPHLTQQLSKMGTKIIFHAVNGGRASSEYSKLMWQYHESNLRMRAEAGQVWIVTVDNCFPMNIDCSCPSGIIGPQGTWVVKTHSKGEQFFTYTIEIEG
ncbi:MAG: carbon-nitrogen hydrolase family protein [bacterium]